MPIPPRIYLFSLCITLLSLQSCDLNRQGTVVEKYDYDEESIPGDTTHHHTIHILGSFRNDIVTAALHGRSIYLGRLTSDKTTGSTGVSLSCRLTDTATTAVVHNSSDRSSHEPEQITVMHHNAKPPEFVEININGLRYKLVLRNYRQIYVRKFQDADSMEVYYTNRPVPSI